MIKWRQISVRSIRSRPPSRQLQLWSPPRRFRSTLWTVPLPRSLLRRPRKHTTLFPSKYRETPTPLISVRPSAQCSRRLKTSKYCKIYSVSQHQRYFCGQAQGLNSQINRIHSDWAGGKQPPAHGHQQQRSQPFRGCKLAPLPPTGSLFAGTAHIQLRTGPAGSGKDS